jgi:hypothetical protein
MTNKSLKRRLWAVTAIIAILIAASLSEYLIRGGTANTFIGNNATLFALIVAAYIAFIFQQRGKFVDDLRRWWNEMVQAKSEFYIYCDMQNPSEGDYFRGFYKISTAMDTLRLIYCNVGRSPQNQIGYYPFEQVRDIVDVAKSIAPAKNPSQADRTTAKLAIDLIFQSLRHAIQSEASASTPDEPTLSKNEHRKRYFAEIKNGLNIDIEAVQVQNKSEPMWPKQPEDETTRGP